MLVVLLCKLNIVVDIIAIMIITVHKDGWSPLHYAAHFGNREVSELLLSRGAEINLQNNVSSASKIRFEQNSHA